MNHVLRRRVVRRQRVREEKICIKSQQITSWRQQPTFNEALLFSIAPINISIFFLPHFVRRQVGTQCRESKTLLFIYVRLNIILLNHVGGEHTKLFKPFWGILECNTMHKAANAFIARRLPNGTKANSNVQFAAKIFLSSQCSALQCYLILTAPLVYLCPLSSHSLVVDDHWACKRFVQLLLERNNKHKKLQNKQLCKKVYNRWANSFISYLIKKIVQFHV